MNHRFIFPALLTIAFAATDHISALAQAEPQQAPRSQQEQAAPPPIYKPPLRGAPGGRIGGASRGPMTATRPLPVIELLAPANHAGVTTSATPTLYYFVSSPVAWPTQFTVRAPMQAAPVVETTIPSPPAPGIYAIRLGDHRVHLQPGIPYTWSVSIVLDPRAYSRNIIASATIISDLTHASAAQTMPPMHRPSSLAESGIWYDAVAAAVDVENLDRHAALDALMQQVGLRAAVAYDQSTPRR